MANVYATKTGNWSDTTVWNTGALPTSADDVYANTYTVTIDQNVTALSLRNTAATGITAGGGFACSTARTIDCSGGAGFIPGTVTLLTLSGSVTITTLGAVLTQSSGLGVSLTASLVKHTGSLTTSASGNCMTVGNTGNLTVTGNLSSSSSGNCITVTNGSGGQGVVTVTGSLSSSLGSCILITTNVASSVTVNGSVSGSNCVSLSLGNGSGNHSFTGSITAGTAPAVSITATTPTNSTCTTTGPFYCGSNGALPFYTNVPFRLSPISSNEFRFLTPAATTSSLFSIDVPTGPATSDVRSGTTYVFGGVTRTGTLAVPPTNSVASGVPVDNTTGTAALTPSDVAALVGAQIAAALDSAP